MSDDLYDGPCEAGCQHFHGGEVRHHKDCGHYPESLTKLNADHIEELEAEVDYLRRWQNAAFWANPNIDIDIDKCPEAQEELKDKTNEQQ